MDLLNLNFGFVQVLQSNHVTQGLGRQQWVGFYGYHKPEHVLPWGGVAKKN